MNKKSVHLLAFMVLGALTVAAACEVEPATSMAELTIDDGFSEEGDPLSPDDLAMPDEVAPQGLESRSAEPQVNCRIDSIQGIRWRKACSWCPNLPQYKNGDCASTGEGCENCVANCKAQFTSAGGWTIFNHSDTLCPV